MELYSTEYDMPYSFRTPWNEWNYMDLILQGRGGGAEKGITTTSLRDSVALIIICTTFPEKKIKK